MNECFTSVSQMTTHKGFFPSMPSLCTEHTLLPGFFFFFCLAFCIILKNSAALQLGICISWEQKIFMHGTEIKLSFYRKKKEHAKAVDWVRDCV